MPRIMIKGGIWKNTEDEILKAAVMKYGKNQWARIASLLHKKSAKQCKARWYEWLDPSIKKTEWSREEEEKLLHLAKLMPCQWRTIAPIVGRTPAQCLEHYEYLLDKAQQKEGEVDDDPRRLRPGEIDPNPETKPARPDPVDMDEDEKEMLAEARARLANTQGKKAKRKAREKQMEEARRLASLQKRRELRAAGIGGGRYRKKRKRGVDYAEEIPFEKKPPPGFYDTTAENADLKNPNFRKMQDRDVIGETRDQREARERKLDREKQKKKESDPIAIMQMNKVNNPDVLSKRSKLVLPSPQISNIELEEVVKLGIASEGARSMVEETGLTASQELLANYSQTMTPGATPISALLAAGRTPHGTPHGTPGGMFMTGSTPRLGGHTPGLDMMTSSMTPGQTPLRDQLSINESSSDGGFDDSYSQQVDIHAHLRAGLMTLPEPKNDFEIVLPEEESLPVDTSMETSTFIIDASDIEEQRKKKLKEQEEADRRTWSQSVQRNLPRPSDINTTILKGAPHRDQKYRDLYEAEELIKHEMLIMLRHDLVHHTPPGANIKKSNMTTLKAELTKKPLMKLTEEEMKEAHEILSKEMEIVKDGMGHGNVSSDVYTHVWEECYNEVLFIPSQNRYTRASMGSNKDRLESLEKRLQGNRALMGKEAKKAAKLEKKLKILLGGYMARGQALSKQLSDTHEQVEQSVVELETFKKLQSLERMAMPKRFQKLKEEVEELSDKENKLQVEYANISHSE